MRNYLRLFRYARRQRGAFTLIAALTLVAPKGAGPGDSYRFNVVQRHGRRVGGGSTYVLAVTAPDQRESA